MPYEAVRMAADDSLADSLATSGAEEGLIGEQAHEAGVPPRRLPRLVAGALAAAALLAVAARLAHQPKTTAPPAQALPAEVTSLAKVVTHGEAKAAVISSTFGLEGCVGIGNNPQTAAKYNCNVVNSTSPTGTVSQVTSAPPKTFGLLCGSISTYRKACTMRTPCDAIPTSFNFPVLGSTLNATDFVFVTANGTEVTPVCATFNPANEPNEQQTVTLVGQFGGRDAANWPAEVKVVDSLTLFDPFTGAQVEAKGLTLKASSASYGKAGAWSGNKSLPIAHNQQYGQSLQYTSGNTILRAYAFPFTTKGETMGCNGGGGCNYPNHCQVDFNKTTHVIKLLMSGGTTPDGVLSFIPSDTHVFKVGLADGTYLAKEKLLGLADLGAKQNYTEPYRDSYAQDGDNYIDLCLQLSDEEFGSLAVVTTAANQFFPPRGTGPNVAHGATVTMQAKDKNGNLTVPWNMPN